MLRRIMIFVILTANGIFGSDYVKYSPSYKDYEKEGKYIHYDASYVYVFDRKIDLSLLNALKTKDTKYIEDALRQGATSSYLEFPKADDPTQYFEIDIARRATKDMIYELGVCDYDNNEKTHSKNWTLEEFNRRNLEILKLLTKYGKFKDNPCWGLRPLCKEKEKKTKYAETLKYLRKYHRYEKEWRMKNEDANVDCHG